MTGNARRLTINIEYTVERVNPLGLWHDDQRVADRAGRRFFILRYNYYDKAQQDLDNTFSAVCDESRSRFSAGDILIWRKR